MKYDKSYCEEKGISTSNLNEAQRTLYYIAENMKMAESISEEGYKHFNMAIKALEHCWIPVSERWPEEGTLVLVTCQDLYLHRLNPCIGWRNGQYWHTFCAKGDTSIQYPIAWQPLPEPYKAEREE